MDDKRDIQKSNPLFRFFDTNAIRTNPFGANQSADRAYRRAERIVAALYLVTNHISPTESIRIATRTAALRLLRDMLSLRDEMRAVDSNTVMACRASIRHLISLVRMLAVSGFLSMQNTDAVIEGLDELGNFIVTVANSPLSESTVLSRDGFLDIHKHILKDVKDTRIIKDDIMQKDITDVSDMSVHNGSLHVREEGILALLKIGGTLGIRDISANLPEYSPKMIQRHLLTLVAAGRVKKTGLKRWSRYSVA